MTWTKAGKGKTQPSGIIILIKSKYNQGLERYLIKEASALSVFWLQYVFN